jgi:hypothetical protein
VDECYYWLALEFRICREFGRMPEAVHTIHLVRRSVSRAVCLK